MTVLPRDHPFRRHAQNLRKVQSGLTQVEILHRAEIRRGNHALIEVLARLHMLTVGLMAEARLRTIVADPDGFNDRERALLARYPQLDRWAAAVDYAFRRHYSVPIHRDLDQFILGGAPNGKRTTVLGLLDSHLADVITDRNKTAHGQWVWHLNNSESAFTRRANPPLNYRAIKARSDLLVQVGNLVHALVVSQPTFERDFAAISAKIDSLAAQVDGNDYPRYVQMLRATVRHP